MVGVTAAALGAKARPATATAPTASAARATGLLVLLRMIPLPVTGVDRLPRLDVIDAVDTRPRSGPRGPRARVRGRAGMALRGRGLRCAVRCTVVLVRCAFACAEGVGPTPVRGCGSAPRAGPSRVSDGSSDRLPSIDARVAVDYKGLRVDS
ncbi:hypothetical protein GCM10022284_58590 [Streptomyces hundungensis]